MKLELTCGDVIEWAEGAVVRCPVHGAQPVARVINAPAPRFRGVASGPHVTPCDLGPHTGRLAGSEPAKES